MTKRIYLAGQITGLSGEEAMGWRDEAEHIFRSAGLWVENPMAGFEKLRSVAVIRPNEEEFIGVSKEQVFVNCIEAVDRSDIVLVKLCKGFGTPFEMGYAWGNRVPIFAWVPPEMNSYLDHPFIHSAYRVSDSLHDICAHTIQYATKRRR